MSQIIKDAEGNDVEVFTADELQEQKDIAIEEFRVQNPDKTEEIDALKAQLTTANDEVAKFKDKDLNFSNLRSQKEAAEKKATDLAAEIDTKIGVAKKEILEGVMVDHYNETLGSLAGDDVELKKKIEFQYKRLADSAATKAEVTKKLTDAWTLATAPEGTGALNSAVISSGGVGRISTKETEKKFTQEEKALAQKLAKAGNMTLKDEDFK